MSDLQASFHRPRGGADRVVVLAHGAGSDMEAPVLVAVADALRDAGVACLRFNFPYRTRGAKAPDSAKVLDAATREAAAEATRRAGVPAERVVLGGRSMGGRYGSLVVGHDADPVPALGLLLLGYPLHPAGKPERLRVEHFPRLAVPTLFVSGTRDALAPRDALQREARAIPGAVDFHWIETADHGYRPLKASGRTLDDVVVEVAETSVSWVTSLRTPGVGTGAPG